jgi:diacylglycerol kinase family enzyme
MEVIAAMQAWKLVPEAFLVEPGCNLAEVVQDALEDGFHMFVVCGGDGTTDIVAGALAGTNATLGIIPTGTQNNVALSLGIPADIPGAIAILRTGRRIKVDLGQVSSGDVKRPFLEICSVGLLSALFPAGDDIQHGNLTGFGNFLATLAASPPAEMRLILDGRQEIKTVCHVMLVSNIPYTGPHLLVNPRTSVNDGLLDILLFADLTKMDLLGYAVQVVRARGELEDERIKYYRVRSVDVETNPDMPVMVDGLALGEGPLYISVQRRALAVMAGKPAPAVQPGKKGILEEPPGESTGRKEIARK